MFIFQNKYYKQWYSLRLLKNLKLQSQLKNLNKKYMLYIHYKRFNKISKKKIAMFTSSCVVKKIIPA